jgi:hypothetical protein
MEYNGIGEFIWQSEQVLRVCNMYTMPQLNIKVALRDNSVPTLRCICQFACSLNWQGRQQ